MATHGFSATPATHRADPAARARARARALRVACATVLLCTAAGVSAQTVFKSIDAAGNVRYTDRAATSGPAQTVFRPSDAAGYVSYADREAAPRPAPAVFTTAAHVSRALAGNTAMSSLRAITIDAQEAARSLEQARLERAQGATPLATELAYPGQHHLVTYRYWQRQERLRQATELALRRSNETHSLMGAHRAPRATPPALACAAGPCAREPIAIIMIKRQP